MNTPTKRCRDCGAPLENASPRQELCENCRKLKREEKRDAVCSLAVEDATRRASRPRSKAQPCKSISQCVREADAIGISYGNYVARGLDRV